MANLDETITSLSKRLLKRPLTAQERAEILDIGSILGMRDIQEYLYLYLVFRMNEDRLVKKTEALCNANERLEAEFHDTLNRNLNRLVADVGEKMSTEIVDRANSILTEVGEFHAQRGWIVNICFNGVIAALAYWMGTANMLRFDQRHAPLSFILTMPAGWWMLFSSLAFAGFWAYEHWEQVLCASMLNKVLLALVFLSLIAALALI